MKLVPFLRELRRRLKHDKELAPVWNYFLEYSEQDATFMDLGERAEDPVLEGMLTKVVEAMFDGQGTIRDVLLTRLADQRFVHGCFVLSQGIGGLFYFEDDQAGLIAVVEIPPTDKAQYARFSGHMIPNPGAPSSN